MSDPLLSTVFCLAAAISLATSWLLVSRLERVGARLGLSEALLGMLAALAADAPEITSAVSAMLAGRTKIGTGVVIGSNVFNLAALLGLSALIAGRIALHRRVIAVESVVALGVGAACLLVVTGVISPLIGLILGLALLLPYLLALGVPHERLRRLGLPDAWASWLADTILEEEAELLPAIHPPRGRARDAIVAALATCVVVGASIAMERSASTLGQRIAMPQIVVGGLVLAAVTSMPNAVAAIYLARRGRGSATLSTAMNSNALNVVAGLLVPGAIIGLGAPSGSGTLVAGWYVGLTVVALVCAYLSRGLGRASGALILSAYLLFALVLLASAYSW